jgi:hypothetical protein
MSKGKWNKQRKDSYILNANIRVNESIKNFLKQMGRGANAYVRAFIESSDEYKEFMEKNSK